MKKVILSCSILLGLLTVSCDKADLTKEENAKNDASSLQRQSSMFDYIESTQIDNGVDCEITS